MNDAIGSDVVVKANSEQILRSEIAQLEAIGLNHSSNQTIAKGANGLRMKLQKLLQPDASTNNPTTETFAYEQFFDHDPTTPEEKIIFHLFEARRKKATLTREELEQLCGIQTQDLMKKIGEAHLILLHGSGRRLHIQFRYGKSLKVFLRPSKGHRDKSKKITNDSSTTFSPSAPIAPTQ